MTPIQLLADVAARCLELLKMTLADFSNDDMLVRPANGANHAMWQLGHLLTSNHHMASACGAQLDPLPADLAEPFGPKSTAVDNPGAFPRKDRVLEGFARLQPAVARWIASLSEQQLNEPAPEKLRPIAPTVGHVVMLIIQHMMMHIGQMQVIRRRLGKPVLY